MKKTNISTKKIDAITIKLAMSGDFNIVLTAITKEDKKLSFFASNIKRSNKKQSIPEIFDICSFEIIEKEEDKLSKLKDYKFISNFKNLRDNFTKLCASTTLIEATNNLVKDGDTTKNIFKLLSSSLFLIDKEEETLKVFKILYDTLFELLVLLGFENRRLKKPASKKHLISLLNKIEEVSEQKLKSLSTLLETLPKSQKK
ncbi:MAG: hypothetical protein ACOX3T_02630 [Bdellovibrionota bacterium]